MNDKPMTMEECRVGMKVRLNKNHSGYKYQTENDLYIITKVNAGRSAEPYVHIQDYGKNSGYKVGKGYGIYPRNLSRKEPKKIIIVVE